MKTKREIDVVICDFCENDASAVCPICGKDVCRIHDLTLHRSYRAPGEGFSSAWPEDVQLIRHFCPDHLTDKLTKILVQSSTQTTNQEET